jgi:single-stranded DNA-binding protein
MNANNTVVLTGRLTRDPQLRGVKDDKKLAILSLAVRRPGKDQVDYIDVTAWERLAETCERYLAKGRLITVLGRVVLERWGDQPGAEAQEPCCARQRHPVPGYPKVPERGERGSGRRVPRSVDARDRGLAARRWWWPVLRGLRPVGVNACLGEHVVGGPRVGNTTLACRQARIWGASDYLALRLGWGYGLTLHPPWPV